MSFGEHLEELRRRLIWSLLGLAVLMVPALALGRSLLEWLLRPVQAQLAAHDLAPMLQATSPIETFGAYVRVAVAVVVVVGGPWVIYQAWLFIAPGLYAHERRFVYFLAPMSAALAALAVAFLYWVMLPVVLAFFIRFGSEVGTSAPEARPLPAGVVLPVLPALDADPIDAPPGAVWVIPGRHEMRVRLRDRGGEASVGAIPLIPGTGVAQQYRVSEYVKLVFGLAIAFSIGFQMPIVVLLLGWLGVIEPQTIAKRRRHAILACAVAAAVLTPADPLSMILLAVPLYALFELGVLLMRYMPARRIAGEPAAAGDA
jgi:sec-independent protein translocase protein TatC